MCYEETGLEEKIIFKTQSNKGSRIVNIKAQITNHFTQKPDLYIYFSLFHLFEAGLYNFQQMLGNIKDVLNVSRSIKIISVSCRVRTGDLVRVKHT